MFRISLYKTSVSSVCEGVGIQAHTHPDMAKTKKTTRLIENIQTTHSVLYLLNVHVGRQQLLHKTHSTQYKNFHTDQPISGTKQKALLQVQKNILISLVLTYENEQELIPVPKLV